MLLRIKLEKKLLESTEECLVGDLRFLHLLDPQKIELSGSIAREGIRKVVHQAYTRSDEVYLEFTPCSDGAIASPVYNYKGTVTSMTYPVLKQMGVRIKIVPLGRSLSQPKLWTEVLQCEEFVIRVDPRVDLVDVFFCVNNESVSKENSAFIIIKVSYLRRQVQLLLPFVEDWYEAEKALHQLISLAR
jgi:hypothetical protein